MLGTNRTRRILSLLGTATFLVLAPGTFVVYVPWRLSHWQSHPPFFGETFLQILGVIVLALALPLVFETFLRFAIQGLGTPAPPFPTQHLVVKGSYRFVRNPMYIGVISVVIGQALLFANLKIAEYIAVIIPVVYLFVITYEEPTLQRTFGAEYQAYRSRVPRWIPRLKPYTMAR
jgi:protein-S-isoprenylcysteine O-methyltransferase Ste14